MKHIHTFPLFENVTSTEALSIELHEALYETPEGKDLLAITTQKFRDVEKTQASFLSRDIPELGDRRFATIKPTRKAIGGKLVWICGFHPFEEFGPPYYEGGSFASAKDCVWGLWVQLVISLCSQIFVDPVERKEHALLIEKDPSLFEGKAYDIKDLKFLITHLKEIMARDIKEPHTSSVLRERFPQIWKTLIDLPGANTLADLGELGF
jgi:hypothetical protein